MPQNIRCNFQVTDSSVMCSMDVYDNQGWHWHGTVLRDTVTVTLARGTTGYIIHILCWKCIVVNFGIRNVEAFSYLIAFGPCFSHISNPTDICWCDMTSLNKIIWARSNMAPAVCTISQQMHYSDNLIFYSTAPTCFDVCTSSSESFLLCVLLGYIKNTTSLVV
jgi:hypothetical protein